MGGVSRREARSRPNETTLVALGAHVVWSASPVAKQCPAEPAKNAVGFVPGPDRALRTWPKSNHTVPIGILVRHQAAGLRPV